MTESETRHWRLRWRPLGSDQDHETTVYGDSKLDAAMRDLESSRGPNTSR